MSADEHVSGEQFYFHGTHRKNTYGAIVPGKPPNFQATEPGFVYATKDPSIAWSWAEKAWLGAPHDPPNPPIVYKVRPTGPVEKDPTHDQNGRSRGNFSGDVRSRDPFEIVEQMPIPEKHRWFWESSD